MAKHGGSTVDRKQQLATEKFSFPLLLDLVTFSLWMRIQHVVNSHAELSQGVQDVPKQILISVFMVQNFTHKKALSRPQVVFRRSESTHCTVISSRNEKNPLNFPFLLRFIVRPPPSTAATVAFFHLEPVPCQVTVNRFPVLPLLLPPPSLTLLCTCNCRSIITNANTITCNY